MSTEVKSYQDLRVWQRAMELVPQVYRLVSKLPTFEKYGLGDQIRRAAVSIPANIAEGHARRHTKEFLQHLSIARASLAELHTLLLIAERLEFFPREVVGQVEEAIANLGMPLSGLIRKLEAKL
jgi:four helix bundle protein